MTGRPDKEESGSDAPADEPQGNSLEDAAEEAVRFMEKSDEPGHAGRGDYG